MPNDSAQQHRDAAGHAPVGIAIVTVSDSRTPETDTNRHYLEARIAEAGHHIAGYRLVRDEPDQISAALDDCAALPAAQIILFNGGTGISRRDTTYDVIARALEKTLPGFGELFRLLSYEQVGAAAMLSRATAGVYRGRFVASLPGSPDAVRLAFERLILPEINHLAWEITR